MTPSETHLFGPGRKRMLCLDGGGIRGALTLAYLERLEEVLAEVEGAPVRLGDWFDLIGGTSTGSIIATALALGFRVRDIRDFYWNLGPRIFKRRLAWIFGWNTKFDARTLTAELHRILGDRTMDSPDLQTGLCIVMKRLDTGSAWIVTNNPRSAFWEDAADGSYRGNRYLPVKSLVRASTAAPTFFDPEPITVASGQVPAVFIDGALTPHNNPSLMMTMTALLPAFGLKWTPGPENLLVVSVGTGSFRPTLGYEEARASSSLGLAMKSLAAIVAENQQLVLTLMTYFGESVWPWVINSEIGDLAHVTPMGGNMFRLARYDVRLEHDWLARELGTTMTPAELLGLRRMDDPTHLDVLHELGRKGAALQVRSEHLSAFRRSESYGS